MLKWPKRPLLGAGSFGVVFVVATAGTSCVVYTPELLHEDAVSLGRTTPTSTSSPASPGPLNLRPRPLEQRADTPPELAFVVSRGSTPSRYAADLDAEAIELDPEAELDLATQDGGVTDAGPDAQ